MTAGSLEGNTQQKLLTEQCQTFATPSLPKFHQA